MFPNLKCYLSKLDINLKADAQDSLLLLYSYVYIIVLQRNMYHDVIVKSVV